MVINSPCISVASQRKSYFESILHVQHRMVRGCAHTVTEEPRLMRPGHLVAVPSGTYGLPRFHGGEE